MANQHLMNEVPMYRFLYYTMNDLMIVIAIIGLIMIICLLIQLIFWIFKPVNNDGLDTPDERFEFRVRLSSLEQEVEKLKKRSDRK